MDNQPPIGEGNAMVGGGRAALREGSICIQSHPLAPISDSLPSPAGAAPRDARRESREQPQGSRRCSSKEIGVVEEPSTPR